MSVFWTTHVRDITSTRVRASVATHLLLCCLLCVWECLFRADEGTFGAGGWGARASEVLLRVRGKDFRHEKTKKKRGTYRGGLISNAVNSIKLSFSDDGE